jgi:hypothetical protein
VLQIGFIMFNPYSTIEQLAESAHFLHDIGELYRVYPLTRSLSVFPGTPIAKQLVADGLLERVSYLEGAGGYSYRSVAVARAARAMAQLYSNCCLTTSCLQFQGPEPLGSMDQDLSER